MANALSNPASNYINGSFIPLSGDGIVSTAAADPSDIVWQGSAVAGHIDDAVNAASIAFPAWAARSLDERIEYLRRWQEVTTRHADTMAKLINREMGKVMSEATFEAKALAGKVDITLGDHSLGRVREYSVAVNDTRDGHCRYKPHGVMAIVGPFNFPAHLANGHFVPALLMGNTVVLKPSEKVPAVGQLIAEFMDEAGLPPGVFNVVQGAGDVASKLVSHDKIHGILFTGSWPVGRRILEANLDRPGRIVALEMGGNNPAVVLDDAHLKQAVIECVRAGFATTGQRCTCTRRIIVQDGIADQFISAFCKAASTLLVGPGNDDVPAFMGPLVNDGSVQAVLDFQNELRNRGGQVLVEATRLERPGHFITPGVVRVEKFSIDHDCEVFGPLVQITVVPDLTAAIKQANATHYGLAASIFTSDESSWNTFYQRVNAGCINWNTGTAGASSQLPFGGWGASGNHRPAGAFSAEYCAYPIANMIESSADVATPGGMHWDDQWIASSPQPSTA